MGWSLSAQTALHPPVQRIALQEVILLGLPKMEHLAETVINVLRYVLTKRTHLPRLAMHTPIPLLMHQVAEATLSWFLQ